MKNFVWNLVLILILNCLTVGLVWGQKPLTIEEAIQIALKNNSTLKSSEELYKASKSSAFGAWSNFLPRADLNSRWSKFYDLQTYVGSTGILVSPKYNYDFGISVSQTIFDGGFSWFNLGYRRALQRSSENSYKQTKQETIVAVKIASFGLLKAETLLEVQQDVIKRAQQQLDIAKARYDLGSASLSDYLKAKVLISNAKLDLVNAKNAVEIARATLNTVLGINVAAPTTIDAKLEYQKFEVNFENSLKTALSNHPLIEQSKADLDASEAQLMSAWSQHLPSLSLFYSYSWSEPKIPRNWPDVDSRIFGLRISFNIFSGFQIQSDINAAKHSKRAADERLAQQKKGLELDIRTTYLNVQSAEEKISVTQEAAKSAEEDLNLTQEKYNLGAASTLELLDAQVSYRTAKTNEVNALFDYTVAVSELEKALGK
ncbi:MAG TPA: TolC family protein, partial [candidate division Zixibacteria bacterium]|nr:TolC family protein [candidate division Zixibacteria bacterium]